MKGLFHVILTIYINLLMLNYSNLVRIKTKQFTPDDQFAQAQVPPLISVLMNVPAFGRKDLYDWDKYIQANKNLMKQADKRKNDAALKVYSDRLKRIGKLKNDLGI